MRLRHGGAEDVAGDGFRFGVVDAGRLADRRAFGVRIEDHVAGADGADAFDDFDGAGGNEADRRVGGRGGRGGINWGSGWGLNLRIERIVWADGSWHCCLVSVCDGALRAVHAARLEMYLWPLDVGLIVRARTSISVW